MYREICSNCKRKISKVEHTTYNNPFYKIYHFCSRTCKLEWYQKVLVGKFKIERRAKATA